MALECSRDPYPDLIVREFLEFYSLQRSSKDSFKVATFRKRDNNHASIHLESYYSNAKV